MTELYEPLPRRNPRFIWLFLGKLILISVTIVVVLTLFAWLVAFRLDWLGRAYAQLLPVTNGLYALVEATLPDDVRFKIRAAITDDLGQRSLFLLLLTAVVELTLYSVFKLLKALVWRRNGAP